MLAYRLLNHSVAAIASQEDDPETHHSGPGGDRMRPHQSIDDALRRVRGEYLEMPGLRLTSAQAQRLWGLDRTACDALLSALVDARFLSRTRDGAFVRSESVRPADS